MKNLERFPDVEAIAAEMVCSGATQSDVVEFLKKENLSITKSIVAIKEVYKVSLGEAKTIVCSASCWSEQTNANSAMISDLNDALNECDQ